MALVGHRGVLVPCGHTFPSQQVCRFVGLGHYGPGGPQPPACRTPTLIPTAGAEQRPRFVSFSQVCSVLVLLLKPNIHALSLPKCLPPPRPQLQVMEVITSVGRTVPAWLSACPWMRPRGFCEWTVHRSAVVEGTQVSRAMGLGEVPAMGTPEQSEGSWPPTPHRTRAPCGPSGLGSGRSSHPGPGLPGCPTSLPPPRSGLMPWLVLGGCEKARLQVCREGDP